MDGTNAREAKEKDRAAVLAFYVLDISNAEKTLRERYPGIGREEAAYQSWFKTGMQGERERGTSEAGVRSRN